VLDVLKVDVDTAEWPFFRNLVETEPNQCNYIMQMILEIHTPWRKPRKLNNADLTEMIYYHDRLSQLGFNVVRCKHIWQCCTRLSGLMPKAVKEKCCYETYYLNRRFMKSSSF